MEAIIFTGLQAAGKSSFYKEQFFQTHVRISLDLLKTRYREKLFLDACLATDQRFVIDNTNPSRVERARYIEAARQARIPYQIISYYFEPDLAGCLRRNAGRDQRERVDEIGLYAAVKRLEPPAADEGFHQMYNVRLRAGRFIVQPRPPAEPL